jgi:EAL domain-containing protein (putative c-di-GMP-specific phosphodiesterase class I)
LIPGQGVEEQEGRCEGLTTLHAVSERPDYLKIAGHIVRGLARDPVQRALATALNEVGHVLGVGTIGIQVESQGVLERLRRMGVDYAQGFGIGRREALEAALAQCG